MSSPSRYAQLSRDELVVLVPELLLIGQLIDRSGMAWCISSFGRDEMVQIAIEEWAGASPIYTRRMQKALNYEGDDVPTIFKGLQLDIGAPPQFMDFRYTVHDRWHGEFQLDHCGALLDVEPMGEQYVFGMCHTIEDPTFDATAIATNPRAQVRPIHRPPRTPADRHPHCAWTVIIDESYPEAQAIPALEVVSQTRAATWELDPIDRTDEGQADYSGPLLSDFDFAAFSHSALVRMADEVCLQMHLLYLSFAIAVAARAAGDDEALGVCTRGLIGIAGVAAERIHRALKLPGGAEGVLRVLELHPLLNPAGYVVAETESNRLHVRPSPAHDDRAWISLCSPESVQPLQAIATAVEPRIEVRVSGTATDWTAELVETDSPTEELPEVSVVRVSGGSTFQFEPRRSLPLTVL
ncbi:hypothetical protein [Mycobacterium intracellulare]|uniref:hypothetical protein n=1 Tax=Mycobacterium intracellulare TaxID=1767 RepID=UPI000445E130|nr:hypothetical protein [Mycobacterium intracellulare]AOS93956.1 hypothetical protein AN480_24730 [Mycobacterium intracellulare subsp. chimaera]ARV84461.1 hypothetical protein BWK49_26435 [Mycobacterium intracellulare subsp. chimaera]ASL11802.1 hypothetical protein MYCODSM44623_05124 [Mycobacterium intracellulare subsp. chimaera]ASL23752.1 hypothetical protein MYCOZU1_05385 [Mycobacterium intracellulare subsp. chimaera]ETZ26864.1 hypothetical protein L842_5050 [Mycobacterium intracellulare MIN